MENGQVRNLASTCATPSSLIRARDKIGRLPGGGHGIATPTAIVYTRASYIY
jgi:hypothetical protein